MKIHENRTPKMKRAILFFLSISVIVIISVVVYWNLPFEITRKSDIKIGNKLIENINYHQNQNKTLPKNDDYKTLEKLGFTMEMLGTKPSYASNQNGEYELIFLEGFDGPYLMWNSKEKKWKIDYPTIFIDNQKDYDKVNTIYENEYEKLIYIVNQTGLDNYVIKFYAINNNDSTKIFVDYINDAVFSRNTYKIKQTKNRVEIKTPFPTEKKSVKTKNQVEITMTN